MRKANFKLPYTKDMATESSIYKNLISDRAETTSSMMGNSRTGFDNSIKNASISIGVKQQKPDYTTETSTQFKLPHYRSQTNQR